MTGGVLSTLLSNPFYPTEDCPQPSRQREHINNKGETDEEPTQ